MRRIIAVNTWRIAPGRLPEALGFAETSSKVHERLGAQPGTLVPVAGGDPNALVYTLQFDGIEEYAKFVTKLLDDAEWNTLFKGMQAAIQENPGTELVSTTLLSEPWIPS